MLSISHFTYVHVRLTKLRSSFHFKFSRIVAYVRLPEMQSTWLHLFMSFFLPFSQLIEIMIFICFPMMGLGFSAHAGEKIEHSFGERFMPNMRASPESFTQFCVFHCGTLLYRLLIKHPLGARVGNMDFDLVCLSATVYLLCGSSINH